MDVFTATALTFDDVAAQVRGYVAESLLLGTDADFADGDSLLEAGILDSTGAMELVVFLETEFGLSVADEDLTPENLDSVERITAFVLAKAGISRE